MNLGTVVLDAVAPLLAVPVRWRRSADPTERADGGVNLSFEPIPGVPDDAPVVVYRLDRRQARELFGPDVQAAAAAVVTLELSARLTEGDHATIRAGTFAGQTGEVVTRAVSDGGTLGGAVFLGLRMQAIQAEGA